MPSADNKRVARNAFAMTIRTLIITLVGLYTSRIVLQTLGVEDYGIYGVIGGVVGLAAFLNKAMAGATSRFITFELGRKEYGKLQHIFSSALIIHIIISLAVAVLAETVGLWFVNNVMNFPPNRMVAVNVLYQFTILSMIVGFTQVPYTAAIIAEERMNIYTYLEVVNVALKLLIVYLLLIVSSDRLILYAALTLVVNVAMAFFYRFYCKRHFSYATFTLKSDRQITIEMLRFSSYGLYSNMTRVARDQSQPILLNMFFGVVANAGASIASTITGAVGGLTISIAQAFEPQIVKQYAVRDLTKMSILMRRSVQFTLLAYASIGIPVFLWANDVLMLWLGQVPLYSVNFIRLIILMVFFNIVLNTNNIAVNSTGDNKLLSFCIGTINLFYPLIAYFTLRYWIDSVEVVYVMGIIFSFMIAITSGIVLKKKIPTIKIGHYALSILRSFIAITITLGLSIVIKQLLFPIVEYTTVFKSLCILGAITAISISILLLSSCIIALDKEEVLILWHLFKNKLSHLLHRN